MNERGQLRVAGGDFALDACLDDAPERGREIDYVDTECASATPNARASMAALRVSTRIMSRSCAADSDDGARSARCKCATSCNLASLVQEAFERRAVELDVNLHDRQVRMKHCQRRSRQFARD